MPSVQPNRLVPGHNGHLSAAAASAFAARAVSAPAPKAVSMVAEMPTGLRAAKRHRESVRPEDVATYSCGCGSRFLAAVSTSVACPACGGEQAW